MPPELTRWMEVTRSQFGHEREGLDHVREHLPDRAPYRAWSNIEIITAEGRSLEVDLLVVGPAGIYVVELKGYPWRIGGNRQQWRLMSDRVSTQPNPWKSTNFKAKVLQDLLNKEHRRWARARRERSDPREVIPYIQAAVFLHSPLVRCELPEEERTWLYGLEDHAHLTGLPGIVTGLLTRRPRDPDKAVDEARSAHVAMLLDRTGIGRRQRRRINEYELEDEVYAEGEGWQDFLATHTHFDKERARVRVYYIGAAMAPEQRAVLERAAEREYRLLRHVHHDGLVSPLQYAETDLGPALVYPHEREARRLDRLLAERPSELSLGAQFAIIRSLAETIRYAHGRQIFHRALSPTSVLVTLRSERDPKVQIIDWQTGIRADGSASTASTPSPGATLLSGTLHVDTLLNPTARVYRAPEAAQADAGPVRLDVFGLGTLSYLLLTGQPPAIDVIDFNSRLQRDGGFDLAARLDGVSEPLRQFVLDATRGDAGDARFDNPRAVQLRLPGFDLASLSELGRRVRDLYRGGVTGPGRIAALVDDAYLDDLATAVTGKLGGRVGVAPRLYVKKLVGDILDRVDQFPDFDPRRHYALTFTSGELTEVERNAAAAAGPARAGALRPDDIPLDLP